MINTSEQNQNGNGKGKYQPSKTWEQMGQDLWLEEEPDVPGQEKLIGTEELQNELFGEEDINNQGDSEN